MSHIPSSVGGSNQPGGGKDQFNQASGNEPASNNKHQPGKLVGNDQVPEFSAKVNLSYSTHTFYSSLTLPIRPSQPAQLHHPRPFSQTPPTKHHPSQAQAQPLPKTPSAEPHLQTYTQVWASRSPDRARRSCTMVASNDRAALRA